MSVVSLRCLRGRLSGSSNWSVPEAWQWWNTNTYTCVAPMMNWALTIDTSGARWCGSCRGSITIVTLSTIGSHICLSSGMAIFSGSTILALRLKIEVRVGTICTCRAWIKSIVRCWSRAIIALWAINWCRHSINVTIVTCWAGKTFALSNVWIISTS